MEFRIFLFSQAGCNDLSIKQRVRGFSRGHMLYRCLGSILRSPVTPAPSIAETHKTKRLDVSNVIDTMFSFDDVSHFCTRVKSLQCVSDHNNRISDIRRLSVFPKTVQIKFSHVGKP